MNSFWTGCAVLLMAALPFVVWPLWRSGNNAGKDIQRDAANLEILRDQSAELDADFRAGMLAQDAYEQGKRELQVRLLDEVRISDQTAMPLRHPARTLAVVLALALPVFSVMLYLALGNTKALLPQSVPAATGDFGVIRSEVKLQEMEKKLAQQPKDPDGWAVLARSYGELQRYADALRAYEQLVKLVPDEAQIWANYADIYAMNNNQSLQGEPTKFLDRALELDGNNTLALALAGTAAMERGDYAAAVKHWTKLADSLPQDNSELPAIRDGIKQAKQMLAMHGKAANGKSSEKTAMIPGKVSGRVSLSPALADKAAPGDTVFIFVREAYGEKRPISVIRRQIKDLPVQFLFDDSMALQPQIKLSAFEQVVVVARTSKSGEPRAQSGDLQGSTGIIKTGSSGLNLVIDSIVK